MLYVIQRKQLNEMNNKEQQRNGTWHNIISVTYMIRQKQILDKAVKLLVKNRLKELGWVGLGV